MSARIINVAYYTAVVATASLAALALDWRPGAGTGLVIRQPEIWWALLSLFVTVGLYLYRKKRLEERSE